MNLPTDELIGLAWSQIWQVTVLLVIVAVATRLVCRRRPHFAYMLWMLVVLKCLTPPLWSSPTGCFSWLQLRTTAPIADISPPAVNRPTPEERPGSLTDKVMHRPRRLPAISPPVGPETAARPEVARTDESVRQPESPRRSSLSAAAIAAAVWLFGAIGVAAVLAWKWIACGRAVRRFALPPDAEVELMAVRMADRLRMRRPVAVRIVSEPIGPAVFGLWRPVVIIPQSIVAGTLRVPPASPVAGTLRVPSASSKASVQPQPGERHTECACYLEPIIAHELVHVRRGDAYVGAMQMIVQVLWWFHPLVWWANREMCRRREQCCDEEVVAGLGCSSAAYARCLVDVLEWECCRGRRRLLSAVPGVGSAAITTTRLEHIMDDAKRFHRRTPRWTWCVLAIAMLLVLPGRAMVLGENSQSGTTKDTKGTKNTGDAQAEKNVRGHADRVPTLAEIAKANEATWESITAVDMEYTLTSRNVREAQPRESTSVGRWLKASRHERLRQNSEVFDHLDSAEKILPDPSYYYDDYLLDGTTVRHLREYGRKPADRNRLSVVDAKSRGLSGEIHPEEPRLLTRRSSPITAPQVLHYFQCRHSDPPLTLSEIIASWKATLKGKTVTDARETLWCLHAEYPAKGEKDERAGSYIDFYVNADKGFLVQKAILYETNAYLIGNPADGKSVGGCRSLEVKEFQPCGDGVFFPKQIECRTQIGVEQISAKDSDYRTFTAMKLAVNSPLPGDAFDLRIPANVPVYEFGEHLSLDEGKVHVWAPTTSPPRPSLRNANT